MATRRSGQIVERGKDRWLVRVFRGRDANGRKLYHSKVIAGSKTDARKYLTAKQRENDVGAFIQNSRQTLNEHLDAWLIVIRPRVSEQTYASYETLLRVHIRPRIGSERLTSVRIADVQGVINNMQSNLLSSRTIRYAIAVLGMAFRKAVELDFVLKNPCNFVELPKGVKKETKAMSQDQAGRFIRATNKDRFGLIFEMALITGMRPEEYLALQWSDIDLLMGTITVRRALVWKKGGGFKFGDPKTAKSKRTIPIPANLVTNLKIHRRSQLEMKLRLGAAYTDHDLIFANELGNPIHYRNLTQRHFVSILKRAALDKEGFVLYSLRHTCATLLLASGENPKVVSERLGHASIKMTLDTYSHVLPNMQKAATDRLGQLLYG